MIKPGISSCPRKLQRLWLGHLRWHILFLWRKRGGSPEFSACPKSVTTLKCRCWETFDVYFFFFTFVDIRYLSFQPHQCVSMADLVCLYVTDSASWTMISHDGSIRWRCWRKWGRGGGKGVAGGCLKKGGGKENGEDCRRGEGYDGPPGTRLKGSPPPNLLLYFEKQREGCQRRTMAVTDDQTRGRSQTWWMGSLHWLNGCTTMEETGVNREDKGLSITGGLLN